ncbi:MAG: bifunctional riboflavin kinase/FAD synthetase [Candidatus Omnitrophica bacterium]|nr:bifunctional riboflavin kinase/FAD synthetase [Candidatus Omnitrophota bacterium]
MKLFNNFDEYTKRKPLFLTIGFFDGVHLGHQKILKTLVKKAKAERYPSAVITFSFHPLKLLSYSHGKLLVMPLEQKLHYFERLGVDYAFVLDFNKHIVEMQDKDFIEKILAKKLKVEKLYIGEDFRFGKSRRGDIKLLKKEGKKFGFSVIAVSLMKIGSETVSSTKIRGLITEGNFERIEKFLGRKYSLLGKVTEGKGISKDIKFPTANIHFDEVFLPPEGIYAGWAKIGKKNYKSAFFVTTEPKRLIEAHIIGLKKNIYHKQVKIIFFKKIRSRITFKTRQEAQKQIAEDVEKVGEMLEENE